jgi:hypothetical protein
MKVLKGSDPAVGPRTGDRKYESRIQAFVACFVAEAEPRVRRPHLNRGLFFANFPEGKRTKWALAREQMKDRVWLRPERVAQIKFTKWTPDRHLRHSRFTGLRQDKTRGKLSANRCTLLHIA